MSNIEEDIKFIEEMIKEYKTFGDLHNPDFEDIDRIYKALENMLNRIKELEEEKKTNLHKINSLEKENEDICTRVNNEYIKKENSIPKQKVKDRIEGLKLSGGSNGKDNVENLARELAIEVLEELLEEK